MALVRIDKFISERTEYSRSQIKQLISKKMITVDGQAVKTADMKINQR